MLAVVLAFTAGCGKPPAAAPRWPGPDALSGQAALGQVERFVQLGPRDAGTPGAARAAEYLSARLVESGLTVEVDTFEDPTPSGPAVFRNVIGRLPGTEPGVILLVSHYDTKSGIAADFAGANDSGSSTGLLLELARVLREKRGGPAVEFLFTDGEECRVAYGPRDGLHGSRRHAARIQAEGRVPEVRAVILLDMVGDRNLRVSIPRNGDPRLTLAVFKAAEEEGARSRFALADSEMLDDHVPFLEAGMPAVDLIDFQYGEEGDNRYWHTPGDTLDKLSAESLQTVGRVVLRLLPTL